MATPHAAISARDVAMVCAGAAGAALLANWSRLLSPSANAVVAATRAPAETEADSPQDFVQMTDAVIDTTHWTEKACNPSRPQHAWIRQLYA